MTTAKEIIDTLNRLFLSTPVIEGLRPGESLESIDIKSWTVDEEDLGDFVYRVNRILDRLDCTDAQANRWRTQRDEALAEVEALEKQNKMLAASFLERLFRADAPVDSNPPEPRPKPCQHDHRIGTPTTGWKCVDCGTVSKGSWYDPSKWKIK